MRAGTFDKRKFALEECNDRDMVFHAESQPYSPARKNNAAMKILRRARQLALQRPQAEKKVRARTRHKPRQTQIRVAGIDGERRAIRDRLTTQP